MLFLGVCFLAVRLLLWVCVVCLVGEGMRLLGGSHRSPSLLFLSLVFVNICGIAKSIAAGLFPCLPGTPKRGRGFVLPPNISLGFDQAPLTISLASRSLPRLVCCLPCCVCTASCPASPVLLGVLDYEALCSTAVPSPVPCVPAELYFFLLPSQAKVAQAACLTRRAPQGGRGLSR